MSIKIILLEHCLLVTSRRFIFSSMKTLFPLICRCVGRCCIATLWLLHYGHRIIVCEWPRQCGCYVVAYGAKHWGGASWGRSPVPNTCVVGSTGPLRPHLFSISSTGRVLSTMSVSTTKETTSTRASRNNNVSNVR